MLTCACGVCLRADLCVWCVSAADEEFDTAVFGDKRYSVLGGGKKRWVENIKRQFPDNTDDVDR